MTKIEPGKSSTVRVPSHVLDVPDLVERIRRNIQEAQPTVSHIMVHNQTKTAEVTIGFEKGTMHIRVVNPEEDYQFQFKKDSHEKEKEEGSGSPKANESI